MIVLLLQVFLCATQVDHRVPISTDVETIIVIEGQTVTLLRESDREEYTVYIVWPWKHQQLYFLLSPSGDRLLLRVKFSESHGYTIKLEYDRRYYRALPKSEARIFTWNNINRIE